MTEQKYCIEVVVSNWDEWVLHAKKVLANRGLKTEDELLAEIFKFDFKFETISSEHQVSSIDSQNPS